MLLMDPSVCTDLAPVWQIIGWVLFFFKVAIPIIIILFGAIDLGKAVVASKDDEIKKSVKTLVMRAIAGIVIFFIPTIVGVIFSLVTEFTNSPYKSEYNVCKTCITSPLSCFEKAKDKCEDTSGRSWNDEKNLCEYAE